MIPRMIEFMKTPGQREWKIYHFALYDVLIVLSFVGPIAAPIMFILIFVKDVWLDWKYCAAASLCGVIAIATMQYLEK